jgi:5-methylcytosine-specific restriction endonuclease McrA
MPTMPTYKRKPWQGERKAYDTGRITKRWAGYNTARWRKMSLLFKHEQPICAVEGCEEPTYYTDHIVPALECADPYAWSNLQPLCFNCGNSKTGKEGRAKQLKKNI